VVANTWLEPVARQLLNLKGMWKPILSRKGNVTPYPNTLLSLSGAVSHPSDGAQRPPAIARVRTRFNPQLIGFGIAGLSMLDSVGDDNFMSAPDTASRETGRETCGNQNPEAQK
jgi:hypothetical protein